MSRRGYSLNRVIAGLTKGAERKSGQCDYRGCKAKPNRSYLRWDWLRVWTCDEHWDAVRRVNTPLSEEEGKGNDESGQQQPL